MYHTRYVPELPVGFVDLFFTICTAIHILRKGVRVIYYSGKGLHEAHVHAQIATLRVNVNIYTRQAHLPGMLPTPAYVTCLIF